MIENDQNAVIYWLSPDKLYVCDGKEIKTIDGEPCGECHLKLNEVCDICGKQRKY